MPCNPNSRFSTVTLLTSPRQTTSYSLEVRQSKIFWSCSLRSGSTAWQQLILNPGRRSYKDLIEYLEKLGSSLPDEPIPKKKRARMLKKLQVQVSSRRKRNLRSSLAKEPGASLRIYVKSIWWWKVQTILHGKHTTHLSAALRNTTRRGWRLLVQMSQNRKDIRRTYRGVLSNYAVKRQVKKTWRNVLLGVMPATSAVQAVSLDDWCPQLRMVI